MEIIELNGGHIEIMLFIEMDKNRIPWQPYWNYAIFRSWNLELSCGHIEIMLFREMVKIELNGGHIEIMLYIEMEKNRIPWRPYWNYANFKPSNRN